MEREIGKEKRGKGDVRMKYTNVNIKEKGKEEGGE